MCRIYRPIGAASGSPTVAGVASDEPADRRGLFEQQPAEVRGEGRGDVTLPERGEWSADGVRDGGSAQQMETA